MSLLAKKKTVRTYARQKRSLYDDEPPTKRRRVECALDSDTMEHPTATAETVNLLPPESAIESSEPPTSSPKMTAIWSDEAPRSSPPSSPVAKSSPPPPPLPKRRPMFSIFKKQVRPLSTPKQPLGERSHNAQPPHELPKTKKRMVQMQLDLASETRKSCKTCGMEYIPSNAEDAAMHKKFHSMNVGGVDFTKSTVERLRQHQVWSGGDGSFIAVIGRRDALALRKRTSDVLKVVNTELAAVPIEEEELWSQTSEVDQANIPKTRARKEEGCLEKKGSTDVVDRFKTYLYVRGQKCIGLCLAERIWEAYTVLSQDEAAAQNDAFEQSQRVLSESESSSISIGADASAAMLGISRIWTSNQHRKQGIATRLLECARANFLYGLTVEKENIAFSQPTESGGKLARKWFGCQDGWHVYID